MYVQRGSEYYFFTRLVTFITNYLKSTISRRDPFTTFVPTYFSSTTMGTAGIFRVDRRGGDESALPRGKNWSGRVSGSSNKLDTEDRGDLASESPDSPLVACSLCEGVVSDDESTMGELHVDEGDSSRRSRCGFTITARYQCMLKRELKRSVAVHDCFLTAISTWFIFKGKGDLLFVNGNNDIFHRKQINLIGPAFHRIVGYYRLFTITP